MVTHHYKEVLQNVFLLILFWISFIKNKIKKKFIQHSQISENKSMVFYLRNITTGKHDLYCCLLIIFVIYPNKNLQKRFLFFYP